MQNIIREDKVGSTNSMTVGQSKGVVAEEFAVIPHIIQIGLRIGTLNRRSQITQSLSCTKDNRELTGSSLDVSRNIQHSILTISTGGGEVGSTTHTVSAGSNTTPASINVVQNLLTIGLTNTIDKVVEVNTTSQQSTQRLVNTDAAQLGLDGLGGSTTQSLTTQATDTGSNSSNLIPVHIIHGKGRLVASRDITHLNKLIEEVVLSQPLNNQVGQNFLNQSEQTIMNAVTHLLIAQLDTAIDIDQSLT